MHDIFPEGQDDEHVPVEPNLHPDDPANFFKLSRALQLLLTRTIEVSAVEEVDRLL